MWSFVAIVDSGSMSNTSEQVFVTQPALSLQIKRLEELLQQSLFIREGRRLTLTPAGDMMLDYARRVLELNDEAVAAINTWRFAGPARVGMVQDFAETLLIGLLTRFSELHPDAQIYARVAGTAELQGLLERRQLDIVLGFAAGGDPNAIATAPMSWCAIPRLPEATSFRSPCWRRPADFARPRSTRWRKLAAPIA